MAASQLTSLQDLKVHLHHLGGNTSSLLWWHKDSDLANTPVKQISKQFALSAQLVIFHSPQRCDSIGPPLVCKFLDIDFDEQEAEDPRHVELNLPIPPHEMLPTMRILLLIRNLRPGSCCSEIVALHLLKLFATTSSSATPLCGRFHLQLLNLAHPHDSQKPDFGQPGFLGRPHLFQNIVPDSIWSLLEELPEHAYSTSEYAPFKSTPSAIQPKFKKDSVWLTATISHVPPTLEPQTHIPKLIYPIVDSMKVDLPVIGAQEDSLLISGGLEVIEPIELEGNSFVLGDAWRPYAVNPSQVKHNLQMERFVAEGSWSLTPSADDVIALEKIIHAFSSWQPLSSSDKEFVWKYRGHLKKIGASLFLFASCTNWNSPKHASDAIKLISGQEKDRSANTTPNDTFSSGSSKTATLGSSRARLSAFGSNFQLSTPMKPKAKAAHAKSPYARSETNSDAAPFSPLSDSERASESGTPPLPMSPLSNNSYGQTPKRSQTSLANVGASPSSSGSHVRRHTAADHRPHHVRSSSNNTASKHEVLAAPWPCRDIIDVLPLLTWRHAPELRKVIIKQVMREADLEPYILQVIHALHYEDVPRWTQVGRGPQIYPEYAGISFDQRDQRDQGSTETPVKAKVETPLLDLLCERAAVPPLGFYIYWHMAADNELKPQFEALCEKMRGSAIWDLIERQQKVHTAIRHIGRECTSLPDDLRMHAINKTATQFGLYEFSQKGIELPMAPHLRFRAILPTDSYVFKSNNRPIKLSLEVSELIRSRSSTFVSTPSLGSSTLQSSSFSPNIDQNSNNTLGSSVTSPVSPSTSVSPLMGSHHGSSSNVRHDLKTYDIIYKNGDDLRQDQLMMVLIRLIDKELKAHDLDLKFVIYEVLPFSVSDGMMKCVTGTKSVEDIARTQKLSDYLRQFNKDPASYEAAIDTYVRSCAGYCVLNMVFGWGDRHAANLLLCQDGHFFHIDFGFILGSEPNYNIFKTDVRLDSNMLEPMGPPSSPHRAQFYTYAHDAYLILRKFGSRILSLLYVMRDSFQADDAANIKSIDFVKGRLHLGCTDEVAFHRLQETLKHAPSSFSQGLQDWWRSIKH